MAQNPNVTVRSRGVMEKCSYCIQRVRSANQQANLEDRVIRDGEVKTACQQSCPTRAIAFGNMLDENSEVSQMRRNNRRYELLALANGKSQWITSEEARMACAELLAELSVKPRTSYLGRVSNPNPALAGEEV